MSDMIERLKVEIQRLESAYGAAEAFPATHLLLQAVENLKAAEKWRVRIEARKGKAA